MVAPLKEFRKTRIGKSAFVMFLFDKSLPLLLGFVYCHAYSRINKLVKEERVS